MRFLLCDSIEEKDICTNIFIKRQRLSSDFIWIITMFSLTYLVLMATKLIGWIDCNVSRAGFLCMQLLRASCLKGPCTQLNALLSLFWENRKRRKRRKRSCAKNYIYTYTLYLLILKTSLWMAASIIAILQISEWSFKDIKKIAKFSYLISERLGFELRFGQCQSLCFFYHTRLTAKNNKHFTEKMIFQQGLERWVKSSTRVGNWRKGRVVR